VPSRTLYAAKASWFDPRSSYANFVVSSELEGAAFRIPYQWVATAFGRPARTYHYRGYTIWVWHKNLLTEVR
jgi:hypothetical protein